MKKQLITLVVVLGLFGAAAYAQSANRIEVNVPFEFVVGDETLPPGDYALEQVFSDVLSVRAVDGKASVMVMVSADRDRPAREDAKLVFTRYGDRYFLSRIWPAGGSAERKLAKSKEEMEMIKKGAKPHLAFVRPD